MALDEHDREDLLRDGRMMPLRGECLIDDVTIVVGFREQGQLSLYCGRDPVFQFNAHQQLRRVYYHGRKFAAENGDLLELTRESRGGRVEFSSNQIDPELQTIILQSLQQWLEKVRHCTNWKVADSDGAIFQQQLLRWLEQLPNPLTIAKVPNA